MLEFIKRQSTGNRKTWARIPAQSKASFFPQKDFQIPYIEYLMKFNEYSTNIECIIQTNSFEILKKFLYNARKIPKK